MERISRRPIWSTIPVLWRLGLQCVIDTVWRMVYSDMWHPADWQKCIDLLEKSVTFIMAMESQKVVTVGSTYLSQILSEPEVRKHSELPIFKANIYGWRSASKLWAFLFFVSLIRLEMYTDFINLLDMTPLVTTVSRLYP